MGWVHPCDRRVGRAAATRGVRIGPFVESPLFVLFHVSEFNWWKTEKRPRKSPRSETDEMLGFDRTKTQKLDLTTWPRSSGWSYPPPMYI
jgi:hypothetical protein